MGLFRFELAVIAVLLLAAGCATSPTGGRTDWIAGEEEAPVEEEPATARVFETPEDSVFATPWFTVRSVVLRVRRMQHPTVIILPEHSAMRPYMVDEPAVVVSPADIPPPNRYLFGIGLITDDVPPFATDPARYRYPDLYE
jgi:hypothetical protein